MSKLKLLSAVFISAQVMVFSACTSEDPVTAVVAPASSSPVSPASTSVAYDKAFIWSVEGGLQMIPLPAYAESIYPTAINNQGQVVGHLLLHNGQEDFRGFLWSARDGLKRLGSLVGAEGISWPLTIDDNGEVRGLSEGPSTTYFIALHLADPFVWTAEGGMKPASPAPDNFKSVNDGGKLILPPGADCMQLVRATSTGLAIGYAGSMERGSCRKWIALEWESDGAPVAISRCDVCFTRVNDINNRGDVVGFGGEGAFKWSRSGGFVSVPVENGYLSFINDNGDAVGLTSSDPSRPFVWKASGEIKAIELPPGTTWFDLLGINKRGEVIGKFR